MSSSFEGITTALRGLETQQIAIDVTSHNVANANTPGYSRQLIDIQTTDPISAPELQPAGVGQLGTGAQAASINRAHDSFLQGQVLYQNGNQAQQQAMSNALDSVSQVFNDPGSQGFSTLLENFFTSWQTLANNPSDNPTRAAVAASGAALASGFANASMSLTAMQQNQDKQIGAYVQQINTITGQIAGLNQQITSVLAVGQTPNDLYDKRDNLLQQLSGIANIQSTESANGTVNVSLTGAGALVQGTSSFQLATIADATKPQFTAVAFAGQTTQISVSGGQLGGAIAARDTVIGTRLATLDTLANNVMSAVNTIQSAGYGSNGATGIPFFTGASAATMAVNPAISGTVANIATAAAPNQPGDGSVALQVAQLQENPPAGSTVTLQAQYGSMISQLGVDAQQAHTNVQTGGLILQQLNAQQSSVSSVSLNEEASNLVQYQNAYQAAARVISIIDSTVSDMIKQLGG